MKPNIPFPKTRLEDYLEYRKEVSAEFNHALIRYEVFQDKKIYDNLTDKIATIYSRYKDLLHFEDVHYFNSIDELTLFLKNDVELSDQKIKEVIKYEKKQLNKIYELGYIIKGFGCILLTNNNEMTYAVQTLMDTDKIIPYSDYMAIVSAPEKDHHQ
ncbi:MAG: hypothetical protein ACP5N1_01830 [Candidatus Woesearchaeota archaeon]